VPNLVIRGDFNLFELPGEEVEMVSVRDEAHCFKPRFGSVGPYLPFRTTHRKIYTE